jgi:predicted acylesterase/phospholipase RssA
MSESNQENPEERSLDDLRRQAKLILRGQRKDPNEIFGLAKELANGFQDVGYACRLAVHLAEKNLPVRDPVDFRQKWAMWTSKNPDLPDDDKHDNALAILDEIQGAPLSKTSDIETLGIAGGICKRKWMVDGQLRPLEQSLAYYERGLAQGIVADNGYTAINAAFVNDLLAQLREPKKELPCKRARELRTDIIEALLPVENQPAWEGGPLRKDIRWFHETIAEAHFGLRQFKQATERLKKAYAQEEAKAWEFETTARQFAWLARLLDPAAVTQEQFAASDAWGVLRQCYGSDAEAFAGSLFAGKLGIALSGGGFRASFFHIGVLAALAELDLLRHIEVLSCVSGGSIIGAHYALEIKRLIEGATGRIDQKAYITAVENVAKTFLEGVQQNIRTRVAFNVMDNIRMLFQPGFSRTVRLGDLYQKYLYSRLKGGGQSVKLRDLIIEPGFGVKGSPKHINWRRIDKIPIVILNATSVNTGHNWQFTASWMGEPPSQISTKIDGNYRLRRMYLATEAPEGFRDYPLCQAVAASSCVPGLFTPLEMKDLYDDVTVRLVDGGVYDNQGIGGLLDQNCSVMIISDASGQLETDDEPTDAPLGVLSRSNAITMGSVRSQQYEELLARRNSGRLKGLSFFHLKQELDTRDIDWHRCDNPKQLSNQQLRDADRKLTSYGVMKSTQEKIAAIRTDLDSFSDTEAHALMTSGYAMAKTYVTKEIQGFHTNEMTHDWAFLDIKDRLQTPGPEADRTNKLLDVGKHQAFKVWRLSPFLTGVAAVLGFALFALTIWGTFVWQGELKIPASTIFGFLLSAILGFLGIGWILKVINIKKSIQQILVSVGLCLFGAVLARIHVNLFDMLFLKKGKIR